MHSNSPFEGSPPAASSRRWPTVAVVTIAMLVGVALLRYAIDLLAIGLFVWVMGRTIERVLDWFAGDDESAWSLLALAPTAVAALLMLEWLGGPPVLSPHLQQHVPQPMTRALHWAADQGWGQQVVLQRDPPAYDHATWADREAASLRSRGTEGAGADWNPSVLSRSMPKRGAQDVQVESEVEAAGLSQTADGRVITKIRLDASPSTPPGVVTRLTATVTARSGETPRGSVEFRLGKTLLGTAPLDAQGRASIAVRRLPGGTQDITAHFTGEPPFADTASPPPEPLVDRH
jgi:hypothetical protein